MTTPRALFLAVIVAALSVGASTAHAAVQPAPGWALQARTIPTYLKPHGHGAIIIRVLDVGAANSEGSVTVTDTLPAGLVATGAGAFAKARHPAPAEYEPGFGEEEEPEPWACTGNGGGPVAGATVVTCVNDERLTHLAGGGGTPTPAKYTSLYDPNEADPQIAIAVEVPAAEGVLAPNHVVIAGGGASQAAATTDSITVSENPAPFGLESVDAWFSNADGTTDFRAGSHPYEATFSFDENKVVLGPESFEGVLDAGADERNLTFALPPGLVGDPTAIPRCTQQQFNGTECPSDTQVGMIAAEVLGTNLLSNAKIPGFGNQPVYNLVPPAGEPAAIGFQISGINTVVNTSVRSGGDYGLNTTAANIAERDVTSSVLVLWGNPGDPSHAPWHVGGAVNVGNAPFLTLPTACGAPQRFDVSADSWEGGFTDHKSFTTHDFDGNEEGFTGCENLGFAPGISIAPDTARSDTPAGLTVEVKPPVGGLEAPDGVSTADIQNTTVTLPRGLVINPGQAAGLQACGPAEDGLTTEAERASGEEDNSPAHCPNASKVGTDEIETPLLQHPLRGSVYVLQSNPPELKLLVTAEGEGVFLKLVGVVHLNEATGQLTTTFSNTPELPYTDFKLSFSGGPQAALDTPAQCGAYGPGQGFAADFTSWAGMPGSSANFLSDAFPTAEFGLSEGPGGSACPLSPLPFSPSLTAGSTTDQAGGFADFSMLLQRGDGQQRIERLQFKAPEGLSGMLSNVPLCDEAEANAGTCPKTSQIGHASVSSGPGPYPLVLPQPGEPELPIYLTGPYMGAPFGLSIVTPVLAGPFYLGTVVTRASIAVDPHTAQITITTDPLPQVVAGVPTDLRSVDAVIDRPDFMFNPTNCNVQSFSGTAYGTPPPGAGGPSATAAISSPFGMGSCRSLEFKPKFAVSTPGYTTKANGAGLTAKLSYPVAAQGTQSNITRVKVDLPKQLPSRLTTLQKACTNAQFEANPANCPKESKIGYATVHTPLLPVPVSGPAIFVSHGGEAFPSLTMVLQGDNVTVDLVGTTNISHAGITSTTFKTVPDVPFSSFELRLGQGKFSALAANLPAKDHGSFCGQTLKMPTAFLAQNGAEIHQSTKIAVSGCAKRKKGAKKTKKKK